MEDREKVSKSENSPEPDEELRFGGRWVASGSFLGALIVALGLLELGWRYVLLIAGAVFILLYLVLSVMWGGEEDFPVDLNKDALDPPCKWWIFSLGLILVVVSFLGSDLFSKLLSRFDPLINLGPGWLPPLLFFLGIILVGLPLVSLRISELGIKVRFNIGFIVFLPSLLGYMLLVIYTTLKCGPLRIDRLVWLERLNLWTVLLVVASGLVVVLSVILDARSSRKTDESPGGEGGKSPEKQAQHPA